jgi:hypothetical protein
MKGVTLSVQATDRLDGKIQVDFGESPASLKSVAKAVIFEAIENYGLMLDDEIKNWALLVEAKAITLRGRLSTKGLRKLTDLIPIPSGTMDLHQTGPKAAGTASDLAASAPSTDVKALTSKKYFQHISLLLDELRNELKGPVMSPKLARRAVNKAATEIDRLPVLNVDSELLAYASGVSETLRNMRNLSKFSSLDASYRQASIAGSSGYGYADAGFYGGGSSAQLETTVMRRQQEAVLKANQLEVITMLEQKTAEIRKKLTLKYQVEF